MHTHAVKGVIRNLSLSLSLSLSLFPQVPQVDAGPQTPAPDWIRATQSGTGVPDAAEVALR